MALTFLRFAQAQLGTSDATLHTCPAGLTEVIRQIVIANTTGTTRSATVSIVPSGGSAGATNRILAGVTVAPNDSLTFDLFQALSPGDAIAASATAAGALTLTASGIGYV